jgi:thioester reductase-like protein
MIKGCIQLGLAPALGFDIEMTPVDYVSAALVAISLREPAPDATVPGGTYHLVNPHKLAFTELVETVARHGWPLRVVPVEQWWQALRDTYAVEPNELHPVMDVVEAFVVGGEEAIQYDTSNADRALDGSGISCPPLDTRLLDTYLTWMVRTGHLPLPRA